MSAALEVTHLSKTFGNRRVLDDVSLIVEPGEVVGLVGQNGCGKSTLIKILSGVYEPDEGGSMAVFGSPVELPVVAGSSAGLGLTFVHQDLGLFLDGSVLENMRVGRYRTGFGWRIRWQSELAACRQSLARMGLDIDPETTVRSLSQVDRALVAIARAVDQASESEAGGIIVLDEPTSYLPRNEVTRLFDAVRGLKASGFGVIFVSHRIDEVLDLCDTITVLRDGLVVARLDAATATQEQVVEEMLGRSLEGFYPEHRNEGTKSTVFRALGVSGNRVDDVTLEVNRGEILGVTGLLGMGQERLLYLLTGANRGIGAVELGGRSYPLRRMSPRKAREIGLALLPADRVRSSGVQEATVMENITLATLERYVRFGSIRHKLERSTASGLLDEYDVRPRELDRQMRTLSGGNQQKALLAKWLESNPAVLLLHEPTQGVDVGAKQQIFRQLREAADSGVAIVIATTEYEDLSHLCDRVMIMREGRNAIELQGTSLTHERVVEECYKNERPAA